MIAPVIPPQSLLQELVSGPQVTNRMVRPPNASIVYGMSTLGEAGRIVDRTVFTALDWQPGSRLELTIPRPGVLSIRPAETGRVAMTADRFVRVPVRLRRRLGLPLGARVLLIGHRTRRHLLVYPPAALDVLCADGLRLFEEDAR